MALGHHYDRVIQPQRGDDSQVENSCHRVPTWCDIFLQTKNLNLLTSD